MRRLQCTPPRLKSQILAVLRWLGFEGEPGLGDKAVDELEKDALKLVLDDRGQAVDVGGGEVAQTDSTITIKAAIQERLPPEP